MKIELNRIYCGSALAVLKTFPAGIVDTCVTSPPYWGLRDYGTAIWEGGDPMCDHKRIGKKGGTVQSALKSCGLSGGHGNQEQAYTQKRNKIHLDVCSKCGAVRIDDQLGLEKTPEEYVEKLVAIFREVKRVLKPTGTLWLNLGDSYWGGKGSSGSPDPEKQKMRHETGESINGEHHQVAGRGKTRPSDGKHAVIKPKDLVGIPWTVALALRADGWYLRSDNIWHKPNPMPESVTDRPTKSHEYFFMLSKSKNYFYDGEAIKEPAITNENRPNGVVWERILEYDSKRNNNPEAYMVKGRKSGNLERKPGAARGCPEDSGSNVCGNVPWEGAMANKKTVWTVPTYPFTGAHFATFPPELIIPPIKAGASEHGCCETCGAPYERIVEKKTLHLSNSGKSGNQIIGKNGSDMEHAALQGNKDIRKGPTTITITTGWKQMCKCTTHDIVPSIVLDPFSGAGTTAMVSKKLGRDFIGIDLNPDYINISEQRLADEFGLFHESVKQPVSVGSTSQQPSVTQLAIQD